MKPSIMAVMMNMSDAELAKTEPCLEDFKKVKDFSMGKKSLSSKMRTK